MDIPNLPDSATQPEHIGRYRRAELEAMHGKRGRKPPEYFTVFPERVRAAPKAKLAETSLTADGKHVDGYDADPLAARVRRASPEVRKLITDLLNVVGAVTLKSDAISAGEVDRDASAVPYRIEETNSVLASPAVESPRMESAHLEACLSEPVYADPELETELVEQS